MANRIGGIASVRRNGKLLSVAGDVTVQWKGQVREGRVDGTGTVVGYVVTGYMVPGVELEVFKNASDSLQAFADIDGEALTIETEDSKAYVLSNAWRSGDPPALNTNEATVTLTFQGTEIDEVTN